jgi:hypothetical protein
VFAVTNGNGVGFSSHAYDFELHAEAINEALPDGAGDVEAAGVEDAVDLRIRSKNATDGIDVTTVKGVGIFTDEVFQMLR